MSATAQEVGHTIDYVTSADGTAIAVEHSGEGPPLVLVVGAFCDRSSGASLADALASRYTVYRYDRRGRGDSGDGSVYSIEREVQDLEAVANSTGTPPFVYGHSSGGALALEAAARDAAFRKVAVYEPPYTGDLDPGPESADHLDELVGTGRRSEAAESFLALTGAPPQVIAGIKAGPGWPRMEGLAHTLSRDRKLGNGGTVPTERFQQIAMPVLAMAGGASASWAREAIEAIAQAVPVAEARTLAGEHHVPADGAITSILVAYFD